MQEQYTAEDWRTVVGWDAYEVSDLGRVRRISSGHVIKQTPGNWGYPQVMLYQFGKETCRVVHKLVAMAFLGPCPEGYEVNHIDLDKTNPVLSNLEYLTRSENVQHAMRNKPAWQARGEKQGHAKLTEDDVRCILTSKATGEALAALYDVSPMCISDIRRRVTWRHVTI